MELRNAPRSLRHVTHKYEIQENHEGQKKKGTPQQLLSLLQLHHLLILSTGLLLITQTAGGSDTPFLTPVIRIFNNPRNALHDWCLSQ